MVLQSLQSLDDLLLLNIAKVPVGDFHPDPNIDLWLSAKSRRPSQKERKEYRPHGCNQPRPSTSSDMGREDNSESKDEDMLDCWYE